jgi:hypothetical protein
VNAGRSNLRARPPPSRVLGHGVELVQVLGTSGCAARVGPQQRPEAPLLRDGEQGPVFEAVTERLGVGEHCPNVRSSAARARATASRNAAMNTARPRRMRRPGYPPLRV